MTRNQRPQPNSNEIGFVTSVKQYLITLEGLPSVHPEDLIVSENGLRAIVVSLNETHISALMLDRPSVIPGDRFSLIGKKEIFSFGDHLLGRVINTFGEPIDGKGEFSDPTTSFEIDVEALGMNFRRRIGEQFLTGITMIDVLVPLAKGQRQLLFGPLHSGKAVFLREVVVNQRSSNVVCIYTTIGKPSTSLSPLISHIHAKEGNPQAIVVVASSDEPTPLIAIAPSVAMLLAEHFRARGKDVLLILDDLATHAKYTREIALLEGRLPGRESYPGDIFYQHAHIIERAGNFNESAGGGSITLLPVLETEIENYTDLIPTNLMSATDGHIMFSTSLWSRGVYPAVKEEQSVTRVGRNSQRLIQKQLSTKILALLASYRREREYVQFGAQVSERTRQILHQAELVYVILKQGPSENVSPLVQIALLSLVFTPFLRDHDIAFFSRNKQKIKHAFLHDKKFKDLELNATSLEKFTNLLESKTDTLEIICR